MYEFKLGTSASSASRKLCTAFGEGAVSERTARNWFQNFRSGNETLENESRAGRPISLKPMFFNLFSVAVHFLLLKNVTAHYLRKVKNNKLQNINIKFIFQQNSISVSIGVVWINTNWIFWRE